MQRIGYRIASVAQNLRLLSSAALNEAIQISENQHRPCRTNESNPANHTDAHEGLFYTIPDFDRKQLFTHGGVIKQFSQLTNIWGEFALMVRRPATELISCLKATDFDKNVNRYVVYGKPGTGKSSSLAHVLHYANTTGLLIVHVPWAPVWFRNYSLAREIIPSATKQGMYEQPTKAVEWLRHFALQNGQLLKKLNFKTTSTYTWSKREITPEGSTWSDLIDLGLNRAKYATDCIDFLLKEIKLAANNNQCKVLVVIDGFNAFFSPTSLAKREDKSVIKPAEFCLTQSFLSIVENNWKNGAVVLSVDALAHPGDWRGSHLPRYLLGKEGFELVDPFIPIEVTNYSEKELHSQINFYIEKKWLVQPQAHTEAGRSEIIHACGSNPYNLMRIVAPY